MVCRHQTCCLSSVNYRIIKMRNSIGPYRLFDAVTGQLSSLTDAELLCSCRIVQHSSVMTTCRSVSRLRLQQMISGKWEKNYDCTNDSFLLVQYFGKLCQFRISTFFVFYYSFRSHIYAINRLFYIKFTTIFSDINTIYNELINFARIYNLNEDVVEVIFIFSYNRSNTANRQHSVNTVLTWIFTLSRYKDTTHKW